jgi:serine/threonine-protein kinase SRPK3
LTVFENAEFIQPAPRKTVEDGHVIYVTRRMPLRNNPPLLCDFGEARFKEEAGTPGEDIMPDLYKAPEVILDMEWDFKVDVWNMGMVVFITS